MDPVTIGAVLLAIVSGAAGEAGSRLWAEVSALVRRPFRHRWSSTEMPTASVPSGISELAALEQAPGVQGRALALAKVLIARADADMAFRQALESWWGQASQVRTGEGNVGNTISGGNQYGPVLQGRDFTGLTFGSTAGMSPPPPPESAHDGP
jgi:hypothetical protein